MKTRPTYRMNIPMGRLAMAGYALRTLLFLRRRGITVTPWHRVLQASVATRWDERCDLFVALAMEGRKLGVVFTAHRISRIAEVAAVLDDWAFPLDAGNTILRNVRLPMLGGPL